MLRRQKPRKSVRRPDFISCNPHRGAIVGTEKAYALFGHIGEFEQRYHLKSDMDESRQKLEGDHEPTTICQDIVIPTLEAVCAADSVQRRLPRP